MRKLLLCTCVLLCLAAVGAAQSKSDEFGGFYAGANVGGAFGNSDTQTTTVFSPSGYFASSSVPAITNVGHQSESPSGFVGGGQFGYNMRDENFVFGFETDFGAMSISDSSTGTRTYPCCAPTSFTITQTVSTDWLWTVRPRMGYVHGNWLVYGTGGVAVTNFNYGAVFNDTFATAHETGTVDGVKPGWTAGGGLEYKFHKKWAVKGEYLFVDFGSVSANSSGLTAFTPPIKFPTNTWTHNGELSAHVVRVGFNYHF